MRMHGHSEVYLTISAPQTNPPNKGTHCCNSRTIFVAHGLWPVCVLISSLLSIVEAEIIDA
ncbi:hypothetical protein AB833_31460 [Chromatiales bacterium (ex Bugula neritina AB1)]|nr:hypothetical protein AB833_31460 [Chromatiales bacterium (ex Bugula neritina AB1)]